MLASCMQWYGSQQRVSEPLHLELQMLVNCHVSPRNQILFFLQEQQVLLTTKPSL